MTSTSSAPRRLDRLSSVSSASQASYHSAVSSSSPPPIVNPIHSLAHTQDLHIIKVTDDQVTYRSSTPSPPLLSKALHKISPLAGRDRSPSEDVLVTADADPIGTGNEEDDGRPREDSDMYASSAAAASAAGPPPPSPPASEGGHVPLLTDSPERVSSLRPLPPSLKSSTIPDSPGLTFTLPNPPPRTSSAAYLSSSAPLPTSHLSRALSDGIARQPPSPTLAQSLVSSSSHIRHPTAPATDDPDRAGGSGGSRHLARWNTVGGSSPRERTRSYSGLDDLDVSAGLAGDIEQQAELLRRERNSKRRVEAEKASSSGSAAAAAAAVAVGNVIGEGHANYVLMYNMLTGIRIAVSRYQAKIKRALTEEDFTARHKYSFDIVGNELTPSAKYDFKFKDYAPWVFRELREDYFSLDPADYLLSLTAKYILSELGSPGKSGSFFYFSRDYRFIIKTIHHSEHKFLRAVLPRYHAHVKSNPHTLLSRFYGLHRVKLPRGRKIHFVIMNNLFPAHKDIHETYDLKGSTVGRLYPEHRARDNPRAVLKDLNWISRSKSLELGPEKRALLTEQLRRDADFLRELGVMDYSLLVGIHNLQRGNRDNVRRRTLKVFSPAVPAPALNRTPTALAVRRAMRASDLQRLGVHTGTDLPDEDTRDRARADVLFYRDEGGLRATDERNRPMDTVYYLGVIDILTPYTTKKKMEHFWKGLKADRHKISPVPPAEYAARFFAFMKAVMRGGGGGASFVSSSEMQRTAAAGIVDPSSSSAHTRTSSSNHPNASNPNANEGVTPISPAYTDKMPESASSPDRPADLPIQTAGMEWAPAGRMSSAPVDRAAFGDGEKGGDERSRLLGGGGGGHGMDAGVNGSGRPEYGARWSAPVGVRS